MVWDSGWWEPDFARINESKRSRRAGSSGDQTADPPAPDPDSFDPLASVAAGDLKFIIHGEKLGGSWALIQMKGRGEKNWLLIKHRDATARSGSSITDEAPYSVTTGRTLEQIIAAESV